MKMKVIAARRRAVPVGDLQLVGTVVRVRTSVLVASEETRGDGVVEPAERAR